MTRARRLAVLSTVLGALVLTATANTGIISVDEVAYDWQAWSLARGHGLAIENGYTHFPSVEFELPVAKTVMAQDGQLWSKYPPLGPALAAPLYGLLGARALVLINALGVGAALLGLAWTALRLGLSTRVAGLATGLVLLCSFTPQYAQALWPHGLALALIVWSVALASVAAESPQRVGAAVAAGLLCGLGVMTRLDLFLAVPGVAMAMRPRGRSGLRLIAACALGLVGPLLVLSWLNLERFGLFFPFKYHVELTPEKLALRFAPAIALGTAVLTLQLSDAARRWILRPVPVALGAVVVSLAAALVPDVGERLVALGRGLATLVIDLRWLDPERVEPALQRSDTMGVVYIGALKKSLLQSCPWLVMAPLGLWQARRKLNVQATFLWTPLVVLLAFASSSWHGGQALNLRYFIPVLCFASVPSAIALDRLWESGGRLLVGVGWLVGLGAWLGLVGWAPADPTAAETVIYTVPLALAAACLASGLLRRRLAPLAALATGLALGWSTAVSGLYDLPLTREYRATMRATAVRLAAVTPPGSVVFCPLVDPCAALKELRDVTLAVPGHDAGADLRPILELWRGQGHSALGMLTSADWRALDEVGVLKAHPAARMDTILGHPVLLWSDAAPPSRP